MDWIKEESSYIFQTYRRQPLVIKKAKGSWVWDVAGKKYLDFFCGLAVNNLGHCHPAVVKAAEAQLKTLIHSSNVYYTQPQILLARELVARSFPGKVFFCNSGAEANETAFKLARRWGQSHNRTEVISFENSFHGRTLAAVTLTGQRKYQSGFAPLAEKVVYAAWNDLDSVNRLISDKTCAIFIEPVQGEGGINVADRIFLKALRELATRKNLLLVFDEVQCGMGRTGELFAFQHFGVEPDVLCLAKGLGGGLPIGAVVAKPEIAALFSPGDHASTFGGNPVVAAAALAVLKTMSPAFLAAARKKGLQLMQALQGLQREYPSLIKEVRGLGLMLGMELTVLGSTYVDSCRQMGLLINCTHDTVLRIVPPLTVSGPEIASGVKILNQAFALAASGKIHVKN